MTPRKPYPARTWKDIQRANKQLQDEFSRQCGGAAFDMACDMAMNDGGASIRRLDRQRETLRKAQQDRQDDILAACLLLGVKEGSLGIKDGKVFGAQSLEKVESIAQRYSECLHTWNRVREAANLPPLALLEEAA